MDWIEKLNVGDKVIVDDKYIETVTAIHKLHVLCCKEKYKKTNGRRVGDSGWYSNYITEATPEAIAKIEEQKKRSGLMAYITRWNFNALPTDALQKIYDIIRDCKNGLD